MCSGFNRARGGKKNMIVINIKDIIGLILFGIVLICSIVYAIVDYIRTKRKEKEKTWIEQNIMKS